MSIKHSNIFIAILLILPFFSISMDDFNDGVKAYNHKDYNEAISLFTNVIEEDSSNISAYYNLGISYLNNESFGPAIWAFEKVLKVNPNDLETIEFINQASLALNDEEWKPVLGTTSSVLYSVSSNHWAWMAIVASIMFLLSVIGYQRTNRLTSKRILFVSSFLCVSMLCLSTYLSYSVKTYQNKISYGVIIKPIIPAFSNPGNDAGHNLPEGTRVELLGSDNDYLKIRTDNLEEYFVLTDDIALI